MLIYHIQSFILVHYDDIGTVTLAEEVERGKIPRKDVATVLVEVLKMMRKLVKNSKSFQVMLKLKKRLINLINNHKGVL